MSDLPPALDDRLLAAYCATCYRVQAPGAELQLRVGQYDAQLAKLLREAWVGCAVLLTAWNPGSVPQDRQRNEASHAALLGELRAAGYPCLPGRSEPQGGAGEPATWSEASVLALDVPLEAAHALAARYGQLAFLWIDKRATPQLVVTTAQPP